jgi:hypothetical protein
MSGGDVSSAAERLAAVRRRIVAAAVRAGRRPEDVVLVGVSKRKSAAQVAHAVRAGLTHVGENYVQEALAKLPEVESLLREAQHPSPRWHFIGRLQRNKARSVAEHFDVVETLDRPDLGDALDRHARAAGRRLVVLIQVDVCGEPQKGGCAPDALEGLLAESRRWEALSVEGLMALPAAPEHAEQSRTAFARLRALRDAHRNTPGGHALRELSMGMSADFEVAIEEGATIIRVGTALFGARGAPDEGPGGRNHGGEESG